MRWDITRLTGRYRAQPAGMVVAASVDGGWAWSLRVGGSAHAGQADAATLTEADALIGAHLDTVLPRRVGACRLVPWRRGANFWRHVKEGEANWPERTRHMPTCAQALDKRDKHRERLGVAAGQLAVQASLDLPATARLDPLMRRLDVPVTDPYLVACDGSRRGEGNAGWAFVTGAGWTASGPASGSSVAAEFAAYRYALACYPDGAQVQVLTDSLSAGRILQDMAEDPAAASKVIGTSIQVRKGDGYISQPDFDSVLHHVRRVQVHVLWIRRNTHPLHALADRECGLVTGTRRPEAADRQPRPAVAEPAA